MSRVGTYAQNNAMIGAIGRQTSNLNTVQTQINSGKKSEDFRALSGEATTLVSARSLKARYLSYEKVNQGLEVRLTTVDAQLDEMLTAARDFRQSLLTAIASEDGSALLPSMDAQFRQAVGALNSQHGGHFLFSGARSDVPPVTPQTLAQLQALPTVADGFTNDDLQAQARIADNLDVTFGFLADDLGGPLLNGFRAVADYHSSPQGPLQGKLSVTQIAWLKTQLPAIDSAIERLQTRQLENGLQLKRISDMSVDMRERANGLETFISDIEDVDMAEAISRFNADQTALEASYRVLGSLSQLSLAKFL
jgi:flagellar hook-associated protein 3 FlgL